MPEPMSPQSRVRRSGSDQAAKGSTRGPLAAARVRDDRTELPESSPRLRLWLWSRVC